MNSVRLSRILNPLLRVLPSSKKMPVTGIFNLEDPKWGRGDNQNGAGGKRKPDDGPPDLDELWRDFNRKLSRLFSNKGGGNGGNGGNGLPNLPDMKGAGIGVGVIAAVVALIWLSSGFFIVQEGQVGVVLEFGKYKYTTRSGFQWRLPYPIQSHEIVDQSRVRSVEIGRGSMIKATGLKESSMLTDDENIIDVKFAVQYRLKDPGEFIFNNKDAEATVAQAAETAVREIVGKNKMDFVLYEGREKIAIDLSAAIQQILDRYKVGILVSSVTMQNVQPPEQVQAAFDDAVKAGQDRERQKNEGQAYANDVIPRARGLASRLILEAEGYRARRVAAAEGDVNYFKQVLTEYQKAPAVTRERMYIETMQQIYSNTSKIMIDTKNGNNLLNLPLDKLMAQAVTSMAPTAGVSGSPTVIQGESIPSRNSSGSSAPFNSSSNTSDYDHSREALRNRDRDSR